MRISKCFTYNGLTVRVDCTDQAQLTWIDEFLSPAFKPSEDGVADCTVALEMDSGRYKTVLSWGPDAEGRRVVGFAFDSGPVDLLLWESHDSDHIMFDPVSQVFYCTSPDRRHTRILSQA